MKIFAASDIHGDQGLAEKLAKKAEDEKADLVILAGDLTMAEISTKNIIGPFVKRNQKVVIIPGNHETLATADFLAELYGVKNLHGYSIKYKDIGFFGCGGANIGPNSQLSENEIFETLKKGHEAVKGSRTRIMVTHVHPANSVIDKMSPLFKGSEGVTKAINEFRPDILLCGHVHEADGIEDVISNTRIFNVGKQGKIIDI